MILIPRFSIPWSHEKEKDKEEKPKWDSKRRRKLEGKIITEGKQVLN